MTVVGGGESGSLLPYLDTVLPFSRGIVHANLLKLFSHHDLCKEIFAVPKCFQPNLYETDHKIVTIKTNNSNIEIRNNVGLWAKDEEGYLFFSLRTNGSIDVADIFRNVRHLDRWDRGTTA